MPRHNTFRAALAAGRPQMGLWLCLADPTGAEICAGAGFDWLLIDGEHAPNGLETVAAQLRAIDAHPPTHAVARVSIGCGEAMTAQVKQYLDLGAQSILVPMVDTAEDARAVVAACRYAPAGRRGVGYGRASDWGRDTDYVRSADEQIGVLVQAETTTALDHLDDILDVEGLDGVFIGPADLSASMGHPGEPGHPEVTAATDCETDAGPRAA